MKWAMWTFLILVASLDLGAAEVTNKTGGLITVIKGDVQIFKNPAPKPQGDGMHILYEGLYYLAVPARVGIRVLEGTVIHTAGNATARIVYPNGDQLNVGPSSSVKIDKQGTKNDSTDLEIIYGKMRAVVNKEAANVPRNFRVKTPAATAGVRGTDFAVSYHPTEAQAQVSVLRGKVDVNPVGTTQSHSLETGMTAKVEAPALKPSPSAIPQATETAPNTGNATISSIPPNGLNFTPVIEIKKITQEALGDIHKFSFVKSEPQETLAPEVQKEVRAAEETATVKTLQSIKIEAPELYKNLENQNIKSTAELNTAVVGKLMQDAPHEPAAEKKLQQELKELDEDVYNKYFKQQ